MSTVSVCDATIGVIYHNTVKCKDFEVFPFLCSLFLGFHWETWNKEICLAGNIMIFEIVYFIIYQM